MMQKMKQVLFPLLFILPPVLFLVAALLPLLGHRPAQFAYLGLVPLYSVLMWQSYQRTKKPPK